MISYGSQQDCTPMSPCDRSHQLGEGQSYSAVMPRRSRPSQLVYGGQILIAETLCGKRSHQLESQGSNAEMPMRDRSQGKGQTMTAEMPEMEHPSRLVFGSRNHNAAMPMEKRSHLFTRGQTSLAEMPRIARLSREGSGNRRRNANAPVPFLTYLREVGVKTQQCQARIASQGEGQ